MMDVSIEDSRWLEVGFAELCENVIPAVLKQQRLDADSCELSVLACDDKRIADLNAEFRDKPQPTNVLSWPAEDLSPDAPGADPIRPAPDFSGDIPLGDIAIAWDTCAREAAEQGKTMTDHVTHLIVHGLLHLLGYDHIRDADATLMEQLEVDILCKLGINNPYSVDHVP